MYRWNLVALQDWVQQLSARASWKEQNRLSRNINASPFSKDHWSCSWRITFDLLISAPAMRRPGFCFQHHILRKYFTYCFEQSVYRGDFCGVVSNASRSLLYVTHGYECKKTAVSLRSVHRTYGTLQIWDLAAPLRAFFFFSYLAWRFYKWLPGCI